MKHLELGSQDDFEENPFGAEESTRPCIGRCILHYLTSSRTQETGECKFKFPRLETARVEWDDMGVFEWMVREMVRTRWRAHLKRSVGPRISQ